MKLLLPASLQDLHDPLGPAALALGFFDGVHPGHIGVLTAAMECARKQGLRAMAVSFREHPLRILAPESAPGLLTTNTEKIRLLSHTGIDALALLPFTKELAAMEPEDYLTALREKGNARCFVMGENHRFGKGGRGNIALAKAFAPTIGCTAYEATPQYYARELISSSRIRALLAQGHMEECYRLLDRPYVLEGIVKHGKALGRTLDFPTVNIDPPPEKQLPRFGVYAGIATLGSEDFFHAKERYRCVLNIGTRPTVDGDAPNAEAHLLNFSGDLYGQHVKLHPLLFLRPEIRFPDLQALKKQIERDKHTALDRLPPL